jgi:hypothetical protein
MTTREQAIEAAALLVDGDYPMSSVIEIFNYLESLGLLKWPTEESAAPKAMTTREQAIEAALTSYFNGQAGGQHSDLTWAQYDAKCACRYTQDMGRALDVLESLGLLKWPTAMKVK